MDEQHDPERVPSAEEAFEAVNGYKPSESPEEAAKEILKQGLVPAVDTLVKLAQFGDSERIQLEASKYVIERNLGRLGAGGQLSDIWDDLLADITKEPGK